MIKTPVVFIVNFEHISHLVNFEHVIVSWECTHFFVSGDPRVLYNSVHNHLFTLPDDFYVYPGHDYKGKNIRSRCSLFVELFSEKRCIESELSTTNVI